MSILSWLVFTRPPQRPTSSSWREFYWQRSGKTQYRAATKLGRAKKLETKYEFDGTVWEKVSSQGRCTTIIRFNSERSLSCSARTLVQWTILKNVQLKDPLIRCPSATVIGQDREFIGASQLRRNGDSSFRSVRRCKFLSPIQSPGHQVRSSRRIEIDLQLDDIGYRGRISTRGIRVKNGIERQENGRAG